MDNRDVVPYNPYLTRRFGCHINVEIVGSLKCVKYLFKYVFKGHDRASLEVRREASKKHAGDEVAKHVDARYVGPAEACWRLFGYPLSGLSHNVQRLSVHLEDMHSVLFQEGDEREAVRAAKNKDTTLTAWFALNRKSAKFREVKYIDLPTHCVWDKKANVWKERQSGFDKVIGRMYSASPSEGERYFLYMLLLHVPGAQSFEDLRTPPGATSPVATFREAASLRGLIADEDEVKEALEDAKATKMPRAFRIFFAHLLIQCDVASAVDLWDKYKDDLSEDFVGMVKDVAYDLALQQIQKVLGTAGKKNTEFDLPAPRGFSRMTFADRNLTAELNYEPIETSTKALAMREKARRCL
jgi:hypothetical protein